MKRLPIAVAVVALALPAAAHAKGITGVAVCGPAECEEIGITGWGHHGPLAPGSDRPAAPPVGTYYRIRVDVDGREDVWPLFYEPESGLVAHSDDSGRTVWTRFLPAFAAAVQDAAARVDPFPPPRVAEVRIGDSVVREGASSYLALLDVEGPAAVPGDGPGWPIRISASAENPWTQSGLVYYPEDDVLALGGRLVKLSPTLAADIEALRPLRAGGGETLIPWFPIGVALLGVAVLVAPALRKRLRRRPEQGVAPVH